MSTRHLSPKLPEEGDTVRLFGISGTVTSVEPEADWYWRIQILTLGRSGRDTVTVFLPTDYRTDDGTPA